MRAGWLKSLVPGGKSQCVAIRVYAYEAPQPAWCVIMCPEVAFPSHSGHVFYTPGE